eukprot:4103709-Lingulodinium_polyedra.AAC.1
MLKQQDAQVNEQQQGRICGCPRWQVALLDRLVTPCGSTGLEWLRPRPQRIPLQGCTDRAQRH